MREATNRVDALQLGCEEGGLVRCGVAEIHRKIKGDMMLRSIHVLMSLVIACSSVSAWAQQSSNTTLPDLWNSFQTHRDGEYCFGNVAKKAAYSHRGNFRFIVRDDTISVNYGAVLQYANGFTLFFDESYSGEWREKGILARGKNGFTTEIALGDKAVTWEQFLIHEKLTFNLKNCKTKDEEEDSSAEVAVTEPDLADPVANEFEPESTEPPTVEGDALYDRGYSLFHKGEYARSEAAFRRFLALHPESDLADNAQFWIGESRWARGDFATALEGYTRTVERYPDGNKVPNALLKAGRCLEKLGQVGRAIQTYETVIVRFAGSAAALTAEERLAELRLRGEGS